MVIGPVTLVITTSSLPAGTVGSPYSVTLAATGGVLPLTFSISGAPDGLSASGATLSGTPTLAGTFTVNATVTDAAGTTASRSFTLTIAPPLLTITTGSLPNPLVGAPYTASVAATGGVPPYTFTLRELRQASAFFGGSIFRRRNDARPGNHLSHRPRQHGGDCEPELQRNGWFAADSPNHGHRIAAQLESGHTAELPGWIGRAISGAR